MSCSAGISSLIVDDEPLARNRLKTLCGRLEQISSLRMAENGKQALKLMAEDMPDMVLLDVDMPDISGIEVVEKCRSRGKVPEIIFTTAHSKYAVRAFRLEATDFLLKPVKHDLLVEAVDRVIEKLASRPEEQTETPEVRLWVKDGRGSVQLRCSDICYVQADRDYMRLCLAENSYLVHRSMQSLAAELPDDVFIRIHRSTLVRRDYIKQLRRRGRRQYVVLRDATELIVGPSYAENVAAQAGGFGLLETVTE